MTSYLRKKRTKFKRCRERFADVGCDTDQTDGCCGITICGLCLELETYSEVFRGEARGSGTGYSGQVHGYEFEAYWLRSYGACVLVVEWDGEEVAHFGKCDYSGGVSCRNPSGELTVDLGGYETGTLRFSPSDKLALPYYDVDTSGCGEVDIAFVMDTTGSMQPAIDELKDNVLSVVNAVEAVSDSHQFSLMQFGDTVSVELDFSLNNGAAFATVLDGLVAAGGNNIPEASDYALKEAVDLRGWRERSKKIIVLVTNAPPGELDDDVDDPEDLNHLIAQAERAGQNEMILAGVGLGEGASSVQKAVDANGDDARFIPSIESMVDRIEAMIKTECPDRSPCRLPYCGNCTCANKKLCFRLSGPNGCFYQEIVTAEDDYDGCPIPEWRIDAECGYFRLQGSVALLRNAYSGECQLSVPGTDELIPISDCGALTASWTIADGYDVYTASVSGADCDNCDPPKYLDPCCPEVEIPARLYITISFDSVEGVDIPVCVEQTQEAGAGGGGGPFDFVTTPVCPECCDANGQPVPEIVRSANHDAPWFSNDLYYHGGASFSIGGLDLTVCLISCASSGVPTGPNVEPAGDEPEDQVTVWTLVYGGAGGSGSVSVQTLCSPVSFEVGHPGAATYCPNSPFVTMQIEVSE